MIFHDTPISDVKVLDLNLLSDERGFFARAFCEMEMADAGCPFQVIQSNISFNVTKGTLRGLHYQDFPRPDPKIVRCIRGGIWDVAVDLRPNSATYLKWYGAELTADNRKGLVIPPGCAHGFITLTDDAEVLYLMGETYVPELARGVRWDDPAFGIEWPITPVSMHERDANYPDYEVLV